MVKAGEEKGLDVNKGEWTELLKWVNSEKLILNGGQKANLLNVVI